MKTHNSGWNERKTLLCLINHAGATGSTGVTNSPQSTYYSCWASPGGNVANASLQRSHSPSLEEWRAFGADSPGPNPFIPQLARPHLMR
jgi:hypothetical protein